MAELTTDELFHSSDTKDFGKQIQAVPTPEQNIGIDTKDTVAQELIQAIKASSLDMADILRFTQVTQDRESIYQLLDTMAQDPTISSVLETYAEDITEMNDEGKIIWAESSDPEILKYVTFLLDSLNVDKHAYKWARNLCLYGDLYLKLYRKSEIEQEPITREKQNRLNESILNEQVNVKLFPNDDNYEHYVEMYADPAEMYELTKFGKTYAYIQAPSSTNLYPTNQNAVSSSINTYYRYAFRNNDINIYGPTEFVHACLDDSTDRYKEQINIFLDDKAAEADKTKYSYTTRRGQSIFYNIFKLWRELMLLQNSILLNRVTKSSVVRLAQVQVGDMQKEGVGILLQHIKTLFEQKSAIQKGSSMNEYTNPGPIENTVYVPVRGEQGSINIQQVGGDVDVKGLADLDYFNNQLFGALRVPKAFFGFTDDGAGFNGGTSLSLISSRYAKTIKRMQNTICQMVTDIINLFCIDKGLDNYINKFTIRMQAPTTQEEIDRRDNTSSKIQITSDVMSLVADIDDMGTKLNILKSMLSNVISNEEVIELLDQYIDQLTQGEEGAAETPEETQDTQDIDIDLNDEGTASEPTDMGGSEMPTEIGSEESAEEPTSETSSGEEALGELPRPSELGVGDMSTIQ